MERPSPKKSKPKILLIADIPNWIFMKHCRTIKARLSDEFDFTIITYTESYNEADFDLIYPLSFDLPITVKTPAKYVTGIRSHRSLHKRDVVDNIVKLNTQFQQVHVVSKRLYELVSPFVPNVSVLSHGVDTTFFTPQKKKTMTKGKLRIGWAGKKDNAVKGFNYFIAPLEAIKGVTLDFCGIDTNNLDGAGMKDFYKRIDAYVSASYHEGNNNPVLEAAAMGLPIITTDVGAAREFLENNKSVLLVPHEPMAFLSSTIKLRDNLILRQKLGTNARQAVVKSFDWQLIIEEYRKFFRKALNGVASWEPKQPSIIKDLDVAKFKAIPKGLHSIEIDQMLGDLTDRYLDQGSQIEELRSELDTIHNSKAWKAMMVARRFKSKIK